MKEKIKNKNAITLLALIITVIILLILATVSISLIINSGILEHAQQGVDRYSEEEELEQIKLAVASAKLKGNGFLTTENLNNELHDRFGEENEVIEGSNGWNYKLKRIYKIDKNGEVSPLFVEINLFANVKEVESNKIIIELKTKSNALINFINLKESLGNNLSKFNNINKEEEVIEIDAQINTEYSILIYSGEEYYVAKLKIKSSYIGGENVTIYEPNEKYYGYGANGKYYYKKLSGNQKISNATFGDPCSGTNKSSYSLDEEILIYDQKMLSSYREWLKESTVYNLNINNYENNSFNIIIDGYCMENIYNVRLYNNGQVINNAIVDNNKFSLNTIMNDSEEYILEIVYIDNIRYKGTIKLKKSNTFQEQKLGGENIRINTQGKYYYVKLGIN